MYINPISISRSNLINDYYHQKKSIIEKFDYNPFEMGAMKQRALELQKQNYNRQTLVSTLENLNAKWHTDKTVFTNIERLNDPNSVVVIGGQQAGLLSGPLYTIHKIISIIAFAKKQEKALGQPVIPVFWIAGEDHDFAEINHVLFPEQNRMKKHTISQRVTEKRSVSELPIDHVITSEWLDTLFSQLNETINTKEIYEQTKQALGQSDTYVDFFASFISLLFKGEGLVLIDSGNASVRQLEKKYFQEMIKKQPEISSAVYQQLQAVRQAGYSVSVDVNEGDGHLFYHLNGERILLVKTGPDTWEGKNQECQFTTDELLAIAEEAPARLSNNVVTRPLMQECLFPTLAFMAGPGELGYWSILKPAFHTLDLEMPPVLPRLSFTMLDRKSEKNINRYALDINKLMERGAFEDKVNWIAAQSNPPLDSIAEQTKLAIEQIHQPLRDIAKTMGPDLEEVAKKNLSYIHQHIDFLEEALKKNVEIKHHKTLEVFDELHLKLRPGNGLQERCWNVISIINQHGYGWINEMVDHTYSFEHDHYVVKL
ncbi:putative cysteine ligase BshC [Paraliobacillus quinghaiensis]|uniref:Putative cysteine ligase BshC n=1 Tax=Paraliobacillus quinghaiensis TaxID=470815 RepID=A0A917TES9_9BACI|nr:bacillithiol biosynthesis cysteine-adding enzyme BshC [Paraliobacillus quinghaiensis]GGM20526.1 putative cysteine ligase BshC [Paraliobacillus quinghaiensis]